MPLILNGNDPSAIQFHRIYYSNDLYQSKVIFSNGYRMINKISNFRVINLFYTSHKPCVPENNLSDIPTGVLVKTLKPLASGIESERHDFKEKI